MLDIFRFAVFLVLAIVNRLSYCDDSKTAFVVKITDFIVIKMCVCLYMLFYFDPAYCDKTKKKEI